MHFNTQAFLSLSLTHRSVPARNVPTCNRFAQGFFFLVDFLPVCTGTAQELKKITARLQSRILARGCGIPSEDTVENRERDSTTGPTQSVEIFCEMIARVFLSG